MNHDADYYELLSRMEALLCYLRKVLRDHDECPGCSLCDDAQGIEYTLWIYNDMLYSDAGETVQARIAELRRHYEKQAGRSVEQQNPDAPIIAE